MPAVVTGISPKCAVAATAPRLTITGTGFVSGAVAWFHSSVLASDLSAPTTFISSTQLTVAVPAQVMATLGPKGSGVVYAVYVLNPGDALPVTWPTFPAFFVAAPLGIDQHLPEAILGQAYKGFLVGIGGKAPLTWTITVGSLPPGLAQGTEPGQGEEVGNMISGTPSALGTFTFTVQIQDACA